MGCKSPTVRTDSMSASRPSKLLRGCILPGRRWLIGRLSGGRFITGTSPSLPAVSPAGGVTAAATPSSPRSADRPRPRPRGLAGWLMRHLFRRWFFWWRLLDRLTAPAADEFARQQDVGLRAGAGIVVDQHRQAVRGRLGDAHVARNGGAEHQLAKVRTYVGLDLLAERHAPVDHG